MLRVSRPSMRGNTALAHAFEYEIAEEPELLDNVIPIGQRRTILELTEDTCRWPIGDPGSADFFFCGGQSLTGLPYCAYHSRVAYQPANMRRDAAAAVPRLDHQRASSPCRTCRRARSRRRARSGSGRRSGRG